MGISRSRIFGHVSSFCRTLSEYHIIDLVKRKFGLQSKSDSDGGAEFMRRLAGHEAEIGKLDDTYGK
jgi:hypothetical protein